MKIYHWIETNYDLMVDITKNITKNHPETDDLLHCVVEQLLKKSDTIEDIPKEEIRWYFVRVVQLNWHSKTSPYYYQYKKESSRYSEFPDTYTEHKVDGIQDKIIFEDRLLEIETLLEDLHWFDRVLFLRYYSEQLSYNQLSEITGIPVNTISGSIRRTKKSLQQKINI